MNNILHNDKPITEQNEDQFQRYDFAKRIADTIIDWKSNDCITIGIYGAWGEGKTSVINLIENEINNNKKQEQNFKKTVIVKFNPWQYHKEDIMLAHFFQQLMSAFGKVLNVWKKKELKKYFSAIKMNIGIANIDLGKLLKENIDKQKEKINDLLKKNKYKIVVFIDDIDRLDKDEIYTLFRLIKQNVDFLNLTYVLAFDDKMVAKAISERFGQNCDAKDGERFLEKIIQFPVRLPLIQHNVLLNYLDDMVSQTIKLTQTEKKLFLTLIPIILNTPRLAILYANAISFAIPMLKGEVNIVDLMLVEAIRIFHPNYYEFIKSSPVFLFDSSYYYLYDPDSKNFDKKKEASIENLRAKLGDLGKNLSDKQKNSIEKLIKELFPLVKEILDNKPSHYHVTHSENAIENKRIFAYKYYFRYFTYAVLKDQISDVEFEKFIKSADSYDYNEILNAIKTFIQTDISLADDFVRKFGEIKNNFTLETNNNIAKTIVELLNDKLFAAMLDPDSPLFRSIISLICELIRANTNNEQRIKVIKELFQISCSLELMLYIILNFRDDKEKNDKKQSSLSDEEFVELERAARKRALELSTDEPIYRKFKHKGLAVHYLFKEWAKDNKLELNEYIKRTGNEYQINYMELFDIFPLGDIYRDGKKMRQENYEEITSVLDKEYIYELISKIDDTEMLITDNGLNMDGEKWYKMKQEYGADYVEKLMNIYLARQFKYWYDK